MSSKRLELGDQVVSDLDNLKDELYNWKTKNAEISSKNLLLKEDMERDTEDECDEENEENIEHMVTYQARCRKEFKCHHGKVSGEVP